MSKKSRTVIPQEVIDLAKSANKREGRKYTDDYLLRKHYRIDCNIGDFIMIMVQDNPDLYEAVEHVLDKEKSKGWTKAGTLKVWIEKGPDGTWETRYRVSQR